LHAGATRRITSIAAMLAVRIAAMLAVLWNAHRLTYQ
jgi:hypothetical protein